MPAKTRAMKDVMSQKTALAIIFAGLFFATAHASFLDTIGVTLLRAATTNLNGAGVRVGQAEAIADAGVTNYEVNPGAVGQPTNLFTFFYTMSPYTNVIITNAYPNFLGVESGHSDTVGRNFYGMAGITGVATNIAHVDNYEASTFVNYYVNQGHPISERIVNQSFTYGTYDSGVDQIFDNYAASNNVLFVSGAGFNGQPVYSPATCYNGIGVGVADNDLSPNGPTPDGRSKPDIIAPGFPDVVTSYTTPQVSGAAAILIQAGLRTDGGSDTNSAVDIRTLKALLLNGAIKPSGWTNSSSAPLHPRYGAGVLNVFNSYQQLAGGKHGYVAAASVSTNSAHPPTGDMGTVSVLNGWDFNTNSSSTNFDRVNHYYFNVTNSSSGATFAATATLVWNRHAYKSGINNLDLFLYNTANSNLVACSTSLVDNVEHLYLTNLAQGRYDLQVLKNGGTVVTTNETYALAFGFFSQRLTAAKSGINIALSWPIYPAEFVLESTPSLSAASWNTNSIPSPVVTNNQNYVLLNTTNATQFFRLRMPNL
jgi:Subtilase family